MQNLSNPILLSVVKAFSPLKLHIGGSLQDKVIFNTGNPQQPCVPFLKNTSEMFAQNLLTSSFGFFVCLQSGSGVGATIGADQYAADAIGIFKEGLASK
ncbi:hypothetical protein C4D60_Mb11t21180 [Musa balbisiana]|uniref:Uncharacterized protein n=1 Tax=Musa balbisiana TaxID=52838 RepID=A0A4V4H5N7_MUSBA|nr:hypothetical protein C4D60_Mb11t21180 [Musa balbisiana]